MNVDINKAIAYMKDLKSKCVTYSMEGSRTGSDGTADCSGAVYSSIKYAGAKSAGWILNTESMHDWLVLNGFTCIACNFDWEAEKGDVFIWGERGFSSGAGGHTGIFINHDKIIHCNYAKNGVSIDDYYYSWVADGQPYFYIYRLKEKVNKIPKFNPNLITIFYHPGYGVSAINGDGKQIAGSNLKLKHGTSWHSSGIYILNGHAAYALGSDLPGWYVYQEYTDQVGKITINYVPGYGVNAFNKKGNQILNSNKKFKSGTSWKYSKIVNIKGKAYYQVSKTEFIPAKYTYGSGFTKFN